MLMSVETERVSPTELRVGDKIELDGVEYFVLREAKPASDQRYDLELEERGPTGDIARVHLTAPGERVTRILVDAPVVERMPGAHL